MLTTCRQARLAVSAVFNLNPQYISFLLYKTYFLAWSFDISKLSAHLTGFCNLRPHSITEAMHLEIKLTTSVPRAVFRLLLN
jgi:hypothetical protein